MSTDHATVLGPTSHRDTSHRAPWFYAGIGFLLFLVVVAGFWPQYYRPLLAGAPLKPLIQHWAIHLHAGLNLLWIAFFAMQAFLVARGRINLHRRLGPWIAVYGFLLIGVDFYAATAFELHRFQLQKDLDRAAAFMFLLFRDLTMFGGFLIAGIIYRKQPGIHKRLMFLATLSFAMVGAGRLIGRILTTYPHWTFELIYMIPILTAVGYDLRTRRSVHPVYWIGLVAFLLRVHYLNFSFGMSKFWLPIGRAVLQLFL